MADAEPCLAELLALANSDEPAHVDRAHRLALARMRAEPRAAAIAAAAFDRARVLAGRPQKFGTQAVARAGGRVLWPVDPATTDSERAKWGLGPLAKLRADAAAHAAPVSKACLRRLLRARRSAIAPADAAACAQAIAAAGEAALGSRAGGAVVALYWPLAGEADPRPLGDALARRHGARLALPVVDGEAMRFVAWADGAALVPAGFGTLGPPPGADEVTPAVVLAPLLGCDGTGARLGQGKGCYDRALALAGAARPLVVGVAFACQELPAVPTEPHDLRLDALVTERGFRTFAG